MGEKRIDWIDSLKVFACLLVVFGHLIQSLSKITPEYLETPIRFLNWFIYLFHMPLFMCVSGVLYFYKTRINSLDEYKRFELKKIINLMVPYIIFYSITMMLNVMFSSSVNTPKGNEEWLGIINNPISPYWFLYALVVIFITVPIIEKLLKNPKYIMAFFICMKIISFFYVSKIYAIKSVMGHGCYFYFGRFIKKEKQDKQLYVLLGVGVYIILSIVVFAFKERMNSVLVSCVSFGFAIGGIILSVNIFRSIRSVSMFNFLKNFTFHIFLMHTIFAAGVRIVLFKFNIHNYYIHILFGLASSIVIPVIVAKISDRMLITNIFFYPLRTIKDLKRGDKKCQKRS